NRGAPLRRPRGHGSSGILPRGGVHRARRVDPLLHRPERPEVGHPERTPRNPARGRGRPFDRGRSCPSVVASPADRGGRLLGAPRGRRTAGGVGPGLAKGTRDGLRSPPPLKETAEDGNTSGPVQTTCIASASA